MVVENVAGGLQLKLLVTGAAGFIGSHLVDALLAQGHQVLGVDDMSNGDETNLTRARANPRFVFAQGLDYDDMDDTFYKRSEVIFHLAARTNVPNSFRDPARYLVDNTVNFARMIQKAERCGVRRLIYASSSSVYGDATERVEGAQCLPRSPYGVSKLSSELLAVVLAERMETVGLRFFNVYGPRQRVNKHDGSGAVIPAWTRKLLLGDTLDVYGGLDTVRDFTYVRDVVGAMTLALNRDGQVPRVMNVGCGSAVTLGLLLVALKQALGKEGTGTLREAEARKGDVRTSIADTRLIQRALPGYKTTALYRGLEETAAWWKQELNRTGKEASHG